MDKKQTPPALGSCVTLLLRNKVGVIYAAEMVVVLETFAAMSVVRLVGNDANKSFRVMNADFR